MHLPDLSKIFQTEYIRLDIQNYIIRDMETWACGTLLKQTASNVFTTHVILLAQHLYT